MALECELKYLGVDLEALSDCLKAVGSDGSGRYFESNIVFDYNDRSLKKAGTLLRLRSKRGKSVLTVKRPPENEVPSALKVFEEIESEVEDFDTVKRALEAVGLQVTFAYEKVREKWAYMDCVICLDQLPFGNFVEIEGTEATVPACAEALGLTENDTTKLTYHALNIEHREQKGMDFDESFVFADEERASILEELGKE